MTVSRANAHDERTTALEALSEARLALVHAARRARESKDLATAKVLAAQAETLKGQIAIARGSLHNDWSAQARSAQTQITQATARLSKSVHQLEKAKPLVSRALRVAAGATAVVKWLRRNSL